MEEPPPEWTVDMLHIPPELQTQIFLHLPNLASVVSLRLACRQLNAVYRPSQDKIMSDLRSRLVEPFVEYYEFLQRLKFPDNSIKYPPPGGWPTINQSNFAPHDKTDFAISVLKYMPYVVGDEYGHSAETNVGYKSDVIDYSTFYKHTESTIQHHPRSVEWPESALEEDRLDLSYDSEKITGLRHIIVIVEGHESGGITLVLDTFAGIIFEEEVRGDPRSRLSPRDYCEKRMDRLRRLEEIFYLDEQTWELNDWNADQYLTPLNKYDHEGTGAAGEPVPYDEYEKFHWIAYLYHKFGWPGEDYRKEECLEAIDDFCERWQQAEDDLWTQEEAERGQQAQQQQQAHEETQ
ncbi:hypothetical protein ACHAQA_006705 [Verticillium albo-atrum]